MGSSATNPPTGADGVQLRALRKNLGLTQSQLAERLRVSAITVHRWEAGKSRPHPMARQQLEEIAEAVAMAAQRARPADGGLRDRSRRLLSQATSVGADRTHSERFAPIPAPSLDFAGDAEAVSAVVEAWRLAYGHQFNPAFGSETSRIDPLPHQRIAVYERMLQQEPLRFLLADDAGAGKTIMTGLYVREMLSRGRIRRVLVVPPAGLVGNWRRELRTLFRLDFRIVAGADVRGGGGAGAGRRAGAANGTASDGDAGNLFLDPSADLAIVSLDTLVGDKVFAALREAGGAAAYDLVVFDEAHKLSATADDHRVRKTRRYELAEALAGCGNPAERFAGLEWSARHLLLLTATPHMGKSSPYHYLWRLLDDQVFPTEAALRRFPPAARSRHFIRRTKEEMVDLQGRPIYPLRSCDTFSYDLTPGPDGEQALYDETTAYLRHTYGRAFRNRPAVSLAMSVFQRRLASSTHALLRSFERRIAKLKGAAADLAAGRITTDELERRQTAIGKAHAADFFDSSTADEDGREQDDREDADGSRRARERNEDYEDAVLGAVIVVAVEEIEQEVRTLVQLRDRARRLMDTGRESKFEKLRELLEDARYADEKWLVFSEHRDTVDYLVRRLEGLGHAGSIAHIHGGMAWQEREAQVERFRDPAGARYMVATDAAGEGINLQFCRLMANYDIPWNPARLEQRMGRVHRYGQKRDVRIVNLVAGKTHEGRVLEVLLKKLNAIRRELKSDKVFDVIGRLFENAPLGRYMLESLQAGTNGGASGEDGAAGDAAQRVERALTSDRVRTIGAEERDAYGDADNVKDRLPGLRGDMDRERYLQLLPGYVRHFVGRAAGLLGLQIRGDLDAFFGLAASRSGALDPLLPALDSYPEEARARLCVSRPENIVRKGEGPERSSASLTPSANDGPSIWLRPGEPVFDALAGAVQEAFAQDALRGAVFADPRAEVPYTFHVAVATVGEEPDPVVVAGKGFDAAPSPRDPAGLEHDPRGRRVLDRRLLALRHDGKGDPAQCEVESFLVLRGAPQVPPGAVPLASRGLSMRAEAAAHAEVCLLAEFVEGQREQRRAELPERRRQVATGFGLRAQQAALRRRELAARVASGAADDAEALEQAKREQQTVSSQRQLALDRLGDAPDRIVPGGVRFLAHALVVPAADYAAAEVDRHDARVEEIAVNVAVAWEREHGGAVRDVSKPALARVVGLPDWPGFDMMSDRPGETRRHIEVKGRAGRSDVQMEDNEWKQANHLGDEYWLYVVLDCATPNPRLFRVRDPFRTFVAGKRINARYTISAKDVLEAGVGPEESDREGGEPR